MVADDEVLVGRLSLGSVFDGDDRLRSLRGVVHDDGGARAARAQREDARAGHFKCMTPHQSLSMRVFFVWIVCDGCVVETLADWR